ncbi:unknown protein [Seminavis robusta]|uniref:Uncharacterized protein n=1 Tax=Seminavis robusta TaxID=568900 RepID=A0A9N8EAN2_9STRA|nr:unknown protein [Seminavis robusta]|eukprot:Sro682_g186560.1 n/a (392) ;mRNA; f:49192-50367
MKLALPLTLSLSTAVSLSFGFQPSLSGTNRGPRTWQVTRIGEPAEFESETTRITEYRYLPEGLREELLPLEGVPVSAPPIAVPKKSTSQRSGKAALPKWAQLLNEQLGLSLFTHLDSTRLHAIGGAVWYAGGSALLWSSLAREFFWDDWSTFSDMSLSSPNGIALSTVLLGTVVTSVTTATQKMAPEKKHPLYAITMQNSMLYGAVLAVIAAAHLLGDAMPSMAMQVTDSALALAGLKLLEDLIVYKAPWDPMPVFDELNFEYPPHWIQKVAHVISLSWVAVTVANASHIFNGDLVGNDMATTFAVQLAVASSLGPSGEAFIGTIQKKERSNKQNGPRRLVVETENGQFKVPYYVEAFELTFNQPGPQLLCIAAALFTHHADVVEKFFYLS